MFPVLKEKREELGRGLFEHSEFRRPLCFCLEKQMRNTSGSRFFILLFAKKSDEEEKLCF